MSDLEKLSFKTRKNGNNVGTLLSSAEIQTCIDDSRIGDITPNTKKNDENDDSHQHNLYEDPNIALPSTEAVDSHATASSFTTSVNIISNIIGGGILALPNAFADTSMIPGMILMIFMLLLSLFSISCLISAADRAKQYTYTGLFSVSFAGSRIASKFLTFIIFAYTFGVLVMFSRVCFESVPPVMEGFLNAGNPWNKEWLWLIISAVLFAALTSLPKFAELWWSSVIGFLTIFYVIFVIIVRFSMGVYSNDRGVVPSAAVNVTSTVASDIMAWQHLNGTYSSSLFHSDIANHTTDHINSIVSTDARYFDLSVNFIKAIPMISVAFSCHYNIPVFYHEMKDRTQKKFMRSVAVAMTIIVISYMSVGVTGYLMFGKNRLNSSGGDVLVSFPKTDIPMNIGRLGLFFHFICVFPIVGIACRNQLNILITGSPTLINTKFYKLEAFCLVCVSSLLAFFIKGIGTVIEINGAIFGLSIVVVLPSLFYIRIFRFRMAERTAAATEAFLIPPSYGSAININNDSNNNSSTIYSNNMGSECHAKGQHLQEEKRDIVNFSVADSLCITNDDQIRSWRCQEVLACICVFIGIVFSVVSLVVTIVKLF